MSEMRVADVGSITRGLMSTWPERYLSWVKLHLS